MHALRVAQWTEGRVWDFTLRLGYGYRRDTADFLPTDRILAHSNPPSMTRTPIGGNETTISQAHAIAIGLDKRADLSPHWQFTAGADVSPLVLARLTTLLPVKYPGQEIRFQAKVAGLDARAEFAWQRHRWPVVLSASYARTWSYQAASQFARDSAQVGVRVGIQP